MWVVDLPAASSSKLMESDRAERTAEHLRCSRVRPWGAAWSSGLSLHPVPQKQWDPLCPSAGFPPTPPTPPVVDAPHLPALPLAASPTCVLLYLCSQFLFQQCLSLPYRFLSKVVSIENSVAETNEDAKAPKYLTPCLSLTCLLYPHNF